MARVVVGVATIYAGAFVGQPLYCDDGAGLIYAEDTMPWVALDVNEFKSGCAKCGDVILLEFEDGSTLRARALDAGRFEGYYVADWPELAIVVDVPEHLAPFEGTSSVVTVTNLTAVVRERLEYYLKEN